MLKQLLGGLGFLLLFSTCVSAHSLVLNVMTNDDDTVTLIGAFDTGASAAGALIRLESLGTGEILYRRRLPPESELTVDIPQEPYRIVLDGGPGHTAIKEGPPPQKRFFRQAARTGQNTAANRLRRG